MAFNQLVSLAMMRDTVRRMTARYTPSQMQNAQIDKYINLAYTLHFPEQFRNLKLTKPYVFLTTPNVDTYPFVYESGLVDQPTDPATPGNKAVPGNIQINPPVYCQGYELSYFQNKQTFYRMWPKLTINQQISSSVTGPFLYTGTIPPFPFLRAQLDIFGNVTEAAVIISSSDDSGTTFSCTDVPRQNQNTGDLVLDTGEVIGDVNYLTGDYSFTATIDAGNPIYASVIPYQASRPISVLFYNQQIVLRPVPAGVFQVEFEISQQPTQLIADEEAPELDEWYLFICALAARLIYNEFPDPEGEAQLQPTLDEQRLIAQRRTLRQMGNQRVQTIFSAPWRSTYGQNYFGSEYSGM
jgi:hypothetical protein